MEFPIDNLVDEMDEDTTKLLERLQSYVPFLKDMIDNLKSDMPQHAKIVALHGMITDKKRKFRYDTLKKCEEVIIKMKNKTNYKKKEDEPKEVPSSTSKLPVAMVIPTIRSPDHNCWMENLERYNHERPNVYHPVGAVIELDGPVSPDPESPDTLFPVDRYTHERPSVYSSAAESIKSKAIKAPVKIPEPDISKPPISAADLEQLRIEIYDKIKKEKDSFKQTENNELDLLKKPSKVSLVPAPINNAKFVQRLLNKDKHVIDLTEDEKQAPPSNKLREKSPPRLRVEKIIKDADSTFGSLLSSIDDQILSDKKKRRDSKEMPPDIQKKRIEPAKMAQRLADKYKPKPKAKEGSLVQDLIMQAMQYAKEKNASSASPDTEVTSTETKRVDPRLAKVVSEPPIPRFSPPPATPDIFQESISPTYSTYSNYGYSDNHNQQQYNAFNNYVPPKQFNPFEPINSENYDNPPPEFFPPAAFNQVSPNYESPRNFQQPNNYYNNRFNNEPATYKMWREEKSRDPRLARREESNWNNRYDEPNKLYNRRNFENNFANPTFEPTFSRPQTAAPEETRTAFQRNEIQRPKSAMGDEIRPNFQRSKSRDRIDDDLDTRNKSKDKANEAKREDPRLARRGKSRERDSIAKSVDKEDRYTRAKSRDRDIKKTDDEYAGRRSRPISRRNSDAYRWVKPKEKTVAPLADLGIVVVDKPLQKFKIPKKPKEHVPEEDEGDGSSSPIPESCDMPDQSEPEDWGTPSVEQYIQEQSQTSESKEESSDTFTNKDNDESWLNDEPIVSSVAKKKTTKAPAVKKMPTRWTKRKKKILPVSSSSSSDSEADITLNKIKEDIIKDQVKPSTSKVFDDKDVSSIDSSGNVTEVDVEKVSTSSLVEVVTKPAEPEKKLDISSLQTKEHLIEFLSSLKEKAKEDPIFGVVGMLVDYFKEDKDKMKADVAENAPPKVVEPPEEKLQESVVAPIEPKQKKLVKKKPVKKVPIKKKPVPAKKTAKSKKSKAKIRKRMSELDKLHENNKETMGDAFFSINTRRSCTITKDVDDIIKKDIITKTKVEPEEEEESDDSSLQPPPPVVSKVQKGGRQLRKRKQSIDQEAEVIPNLPKRKSKSKAAKAIASLATYAVESIPPPEPEPVSETTESSEDKPKTKKKRKAASWASGVIKKKKKAIIKDNLADVIEGVVNSFENDDDIDEQDEENSEEMEDDEKKLAEVEYIEPDMNYYLSPNDINTCKLCKFSGKNIVYHYLMTHPKNDLCISRLSPDATQEAINEATERHYNEKQVQSDGKLRCRRRYNFKCRFCNVIIKNETSITFYDHLGMHTGELRYRCPLCPYKTNKMKNLRIHLTCSHPKADKDMEILPEKAPPNYEMVFGHICSECNYLQLNEQSVSDHIQIYHLDDTAKVIKINMSLPIEQPYSEDSDEPPLEQKLEIESPLESLKNTPTESPKNTPPPSPKKTKKLTRAKAKEDELKSAELNKTVFMCDANLNLEQSDHDQRLEKMNQIQDGLEKKRTSFAETLKARLDNAIDEALKEPETELPEVQLFKQSTIVKSTVVTPLITVPISPVVQETPPIVPVSPALTLKISSGVQGTSSNIPVSTAPIEDKEKVDPISLSIVNRLQDNLKPSPLPKLSKLKADEVKLPVGEKVFSVTSIEAVLSIGKDAMFICRRPSCFFRSNVRKICEKHFALTHANEVNKMFCHMCDLKHTTLLSMSDMFTHLIKHMDEYLAENPQQSEIFKAESPPITVKTEAESPDGNEEDCTPKFTFKISNVTSLSHTNSIPLNVAILNQVQVKDATENSPKQMPPLVPITPNRNFIKTVNISALLRNNSSGSNSGSNTPTTSRPVMPCRIAPMSEADLEQPRKHKSVISAWLHPHILERLFKCPEHTCTFTTETDSEFEQHMANSHDFKDRLIPCLYCNFKMQSVYLKGHYVIRHASSIYGCPYCCYRAINKDYIQVHQEKEHPLSPIKTLIFPLVSYPIKLKNNSLPSIKTFLKPYVCGCLKPFYINANFEEHVEHCPSMTPKLKCGLCKTTCDKLNWLRMHFKSHDVHRYNCRYCSFGGSTTQEVFNHIAVEHPYQNINIVWRTYKDFSKTEVEDNTIFDKLFCFTGKETSSNGVEAHAESDSSLINVTDPDEDDDTKIDILSTPGVVEEPSKSVDGKIVGLSGVNLFKCFTCKISIKDSQTFKLHMTRCLPPAAEKGKPFVCFHCEKTLRTANSLVDHIRVHGTDRILCSLCQYKSNHHWYMRNHMKTKHNTTNCTIEPVVPTKRNLDTDEFIARPSGNRRTFDSPAATNTITIESTPTIKTHFDPHEIDQLPMRPILSYDVHCKICNFSTKVRMNLVRHMTMHNNTEGELIIPASSPVNPVPCLEKKELMFDKMTNFALSSHAGGRMSTNKAASLKPNVNLKIPQFIPNNKRYVCGANNCNYLCLEESLFQHHLQALHANESVYTCSHCSEDLCPDKAYLNIDNILKHYRLHESNLYKCPHCNILSANRIQVEKHCSDKHPDQIIKVVGLRELQVDLQQFKKDRPWRCGLCKSKRSATLQEAKEHASSKHLLNAQYKCYYCDFKKDEQEPFKEHFKINHVSFPYNIIVAYYNTHDEKEEVPPIVVEEQFDTTPIWVKNKTNQIKHIRGILLEEHVKVSKKSPIKLGPISERRLPDVSLNPTTVSEAPVLKKPGKRGRKKSIAPPVLTSELDVAINRKQIDAETAPTLAALVSAKTPPKIVKNSPKKTPPKTIKGAVLTITALPGQETVSKAISKITSKGTKPKLGGALTKTKNQPIILNSLLTTNSQLKDDLKKPVETFKIAIVSDNNLSTNKEILKQEILDMDIKDLLDGNFMGMYGPYGKPVQDSFLCPLCAIYQTPKMKFFENHLNKELQNYRFSCNVCSLTGPTFDKIRKHCSSEHGDTDDVNVKRLTPNENICRWIENVVTFQERLIKYNQNLMTVSSIKSEKTDVEPIIIDDGKKKEDSNADGYGNCSYCNYKTRIKTDLKNHELRHFSVRPYKCGHCDYAAVKRCEITMHSRRIHPNIDVNIIEVDMDTINNTPIVTVKPGRAANLECGLCKDTFSDSITLREHKKTVHKIMYQKNLINGKSNKLKQTARKSTGGSQFINNKLVSYYGQKPDITDTEMNKIHTTVPVQNTLMTLNVRQLSKIVDVFPSVAVTDCSL